MQIERYFDAIKEILANIQNAQKKSMEQAASLLSDTILQGGTIYITGCSHSSIFAQEAFYRAGGLMLINPVFLPGMNLDVPPATRTTKFERISGIAEAVLSETRIKEKDVLIIASISGRNTVPVEMALWAGEHNVRVIALTSVNYSKNTQSRHSSGKHLYELADIVLDVMCPAGDAVLEIEGLPEKTAPSSTAAGVTILHAVISQTIENLIKAGITPPIFVSANLDGGDRHNKHMLEKYREQIHYL
jgi:uncharacterized phosphosugar-binding protein